MQARNDFFLSAFQWALEADRLFAKQNEIDAKMNLRVQPMQHPREWNRFSHVFQSADPRHGSLDAHAEAGMRNAAVFAEI
jgi:hypothetical protein